MTDEIEQRTDEWLAAHRFPSFAEQYTRAREAATEDMLEDILEIADDPKIDVQDKRVRIDARKWAMGKRRSFRRPRSGQPPPCPAGDICGGAEGRETKRCSRMQLHT
jgi:hypothetical protein